MRIDPCNALKRALILRYGERWAINFTLYIDQDSGNPITGLPDPQCHDRTYAAQLSETWKALRKAVFEDEILVLDEAGSPVRGTEWLALGAAGFFNGYNFENDDLERWAWPKRGGGRPKGSGSFEAADAPLIDEMHELLQRDPALRHSATRAARRVVRKAEGASGESTVKRLASGYNRKYKASK